MITPDVIHNRLRMFRPIVLVTVLAAALTGAWSHAQERSDDEDVFFRNDPASSKYAVIITGAAASEEIGNRFSQWSLSLHDILGRDYGYGSDVITLLVGEGATGERPNPRIDGSSRREDIEAALSTLAGRVSAGDQITFILIGHGSSLNDEAKFNIVGPDITGPEFASLLDQFNQQNVVVINTTSASYGFSAALSARGRVIVSATRTPAERYDPVFGGYLVAALDGHAGDRDKNARVSVLEAFTYASQSAQSWYRDQGRLPTERAVLDDNGDGVFSIDPAPGAADGGLAEIAYLDTFSGIEEKASPQARQLLAEMQDLERSVFLLRGQKADHLEADYWSRMETLLIDLARKTEQYNELP